MLTESRSQLLINGILQIWNLFWALFASLLVERIGRRVLFLTSAAGMLIFFTLLTVCSSQFAQHQSRAAAHAVIAFIFLFSAFYEYVPCLDLYPLILIHSRCSSLAFTPLIVSYTVEILPYHLRAKTRHWVGSIT